MSTLTRWRPFPEFAAFADIHDRLDRLFDQVADGERLPASAAIDVIREEDHLTVKADMPGLRPEDVKIRVENGVLTISGEHEETSETKEEKYMRRERRFGSFSRSLALPDGIDPEAIEATTKDGVVQVQVPLPSPEPKKVVEITPKAAS